MPTAQTRVTRKFNTRTYRTRVGVPAIAQKPWSERKLEWLARIERKGSLPVNRQSCLKTYRNDATGRDVRRLIDEGLIRLTDKHPGNCRRLVLTPKGQALLPSAQPVRVAEPYARRKAAMAADKARGTPVSPEDLTSLWA
jgi:hypothetical protein